MGAGTAAGSGGGARPNDEANCPQFAFFFGGGAGAAGRGFAGGGATGAAALAAAGSAAGGVIPRFSIRPFQWSNFPDSLMAIHLGG